MTLSQNKYQRSFHPEYKKAVNKLILEDANISNNLRDAIVGELKNKEKDEVLQKEYFRLAKKVLKERKGEVKCHFDSLLEIKESQEIIENLKSGESNLTLILNNIEDTKKLIDTVKLILNNLDSICGLHHESQLTYDEYGEIDGEYLEKNYITNEEESNKKFSLIQEQLTDYISRIEETNAVDILKSIIEFYGEDTSVRHYSIQLKHCLEKNSIIDQKNKIAIANAIAESDAHLRLLPCIKILGIADEQERLKIAKKYAYRCKTFPVDLEEFQIINEDSIVEIATIYGWQYLEKFDIDDDERIKIIENDLKRDEYINSTLRSNRETFLRDFKRANIKDRSKRKKLLERILYDNYGTDQEQWEFFHNSLSKAFREKEDMYIDGIKIVGKYMKKPLEYTDKLIVLNEKDKVKYINECLKECPRRIASKIRFLEIQEKEKRYQIAKQALEKDICVLRNIEEYKIGINNLDIKTIPSRNGVRYSVNLSKEELYLYIKNHLVHNKLLTENNRKILENCITKNDDSNISTFRSDMRDNLSLLPSEEGSNSTVLNYINLYNLGIDIEKQYDTENSKQYIQKFVQKGVISEKEFNTIYAENNRIENCDFLFRVVLKNLNHFQSDLGVKENCRNLFFKEIGLNPELFVYNQYSEKSIQDFYSLCIRIYKNLGKEFFEAFEIDTRITSDRKLGDITNLLKTIEELLYLIKADTEEKNRGKFIRSQEKKRKRREDVLKIIEHIQNDVKKGIITTKESIQKSTFDILSIFNHNISSKNIKITQNNIFSTIHNLKNIHLSFFQSVFKINNNNIEKEDLENLENKWGNLGVLFTLISRFYGKEGWIQEIPIFSRVVENVLSNTFHTYKYKGYERDIEDQDNAIKQLNGFSQIEKENWKQNPYSFELYTSKKEVNLSDGELLKSAQGEYIEQLLRQKHLDQIEKGLSEEIGNLKLESFDSKEMEIVQMQKSKEAIKQVSGNTKKEKQKHYMKILLILLKTTEDKQIFENALRNLKGLGESKDIKNDLDSISSKLKPIERGEESILFTTLFDDPKLLLEVGDLVDAASCQNYKTGSHIQTLLGYVVDANVKGVLGFAIDRKHLGGDNRKYEKLKQLIQAGNYDLHFDAPKRILKINDIQIELGQAVARRIVKLGRDKKVFLERPYYQNHFVRDEVFKNIKKLTKDFVGTFHGTIEEEGIIFEGTRNPGGIYSDAAGGVKYGTYSV